jgi:drug/metabolite transporter (DMT)-like permease
MNLIKEYIKYIAALLMFGLNGIVASHIALSSYEIVFLRTLTGSAFLALIFFATRQKVHLLENKTHAAYLVISGVAMGVSWMFLYEAYRQIGVGIASLVYYCGPVIVMVLSPLLFKEKLTVTKICGFIAVLTGMFCMQVLSGGKNVWGIACGILSAVMYAAMVIFNKKARGITGLENAMWQLIISFLTVAVFVGIKQGFMLHIEQGSVIAILLLGIVNTGIGCYFYFSSIGRLPVQTVAVCGYLEPLSAVVFSVVLLGETMNALQIFGAVLILGGAAFGELFRRKKQLPA